MAHQQSARRQIQLESKVTQMAHGERAHDRWSQRQQFMSRHEQERRPALEWECLDLARDVCGRCSTPEQPRWPAEVPPPLFVYFAFAGGSDPISYETLRAVFTGCCMMPRASFMVVTDSDPIRQFLSRGMRWVCPKHTFIRARNTRWRRTRSSSHGISSSNSRYGVGLSKAFERVGASFGVVGVH